MPEIKETIEAIGKAFEEFKAANDTRLKEIEKGKSDPVLAEKVDKINAEISAMAAMKRQLEAIETAVATSRFSGGDKTETEKAKGEHKAAFEKFFRKGVEADLKGLEVQAGLSTLSDPDGGYRVPEETEKTIDRVATSISAMRRLANVMKIGTSTYKKLVNKGGAGSGWVGEKGSRDETGTPTLVEIAINTKELYANPAATQELLDDATMDISAWLASEVDVEFNEQEASAFISGDGVNKPKGIGAYTTVANSSYAWGKIGYTLGGHATLLNDADKLIDLQHSLKSVYRNGSVWLMNDLTFAGIRKLKNSTTGEYLWRPGLAEGAPDVLLGKPVEIDDNVDDISAGKFPVWFGNWKRAYTIIDRAGIRVLRDPYTNKPYVHFYTTKRVGGGVTMYEALKCLKIAAS